MLKCVFGHPWLTLLSLVSPQSELLGSVTDQPGLARQLFLSFSCSSKHFQTSAPHKLSIDFRHNNSKVFFLKWTIYSIYPTLSISEIKYAEIIHGGMLKNKFLVQEWSCGGLSDKEGFYDNDHHQDKDWVPKKITNDTDLINIWQPARNKRMPCLAPKCQKPICYILSTFHGNRVSALSVLRIGITRY